MTPATGPACALGVDHLEHVLEGERLEVQPVGGVVVGGDRLGVAVDHHRLVAGVAQGEAGVHAGVVELDALADPVGPGAEDEHGRPLPRRDLGLLVVGRVVVRAWSRRTRRRRCRRSCRPAAPRARAGRRGRPASGIPAQRGRAGRRRSRAAWPGAAARGQLRCAGATCWRRRSSISAIWSRNHGSMPVASCTSLDRCARRAGPAATSRSGRRSGPGLLPAAPATAPGTGVAGPVERRAGLARPSAAPSAAPR